MPALTWTIHVKRSPEDVFAYVADIRRHPEWSPTPQQVENLADGPVHVGTTFRNIGYLPPRDHHHVNDSTVTKLEAPKTLEVTSDDRGQTFINRFEVTPVDGGATVQRTMEFAAPTGFMKLMMPMISAMVIRPGVQKGMNRLRDNLEKGDSTG